MLEISSQYIAGFFDGEGTIGLYSRKDGKAYHLRIQITQNVSEESLAIFTYLKTKYGGNLGTQKTTSGNTKFN